LPDHPLALAARARYFLLLQDQQPVITALKKNYLGLCGYRLPTEAEMEYACRAGAETSRYYGESEELLSEYGWYAKNSQDRAWPVGVKKPNDLGFFDMHGNVWNWCQDSYQGDYAVSKEGKVMEDEEGSLPIVPTIGRAWRGGSYNNLPIILRSATRGKKVPTERINDVGFRPARTLPGQNPQASLRRSVPGSQSPG
jgi:formylglycine-generating enzyme required for sulfatase activity